MQDPPTPPGVQVVAGLVEVVCRLEVRVRCPVCGGEHRHVVDAADHPTQPGAHLWRQDCGDARYFVRVKATALKEARRRAEAIVRQFRLDPDWLA